MQFDPFIEAEKVAGRSINWCFRLFEVSRAAYFNRRLGTPQMAQPLFPFLVPRPPGWIKPPSVSLTRVWHVANPVTTVGGSTPGRTVRGHREQRSGVGFQCPTAVRT